jgi:hypothetical protein
MGLDEKNNETCATCRYAGRERGYKKHFCLRHAPIAAHDPAFGVCPDAFVPRWPVMQASDWCGDYETKG